MYKSEAYARGNVARVEFVEHNKPRGFESAGTDRRKKWILSERKTDGDSKKKTKKQIRRNYLGPLTFIRGGVLSLFETRGRIGRTAFARRVKTDKKTTTITNNKNPPSAPCSCAATRPKQKRWTVDDGRATEKVHKSKFRCVASEVSRARAVVHTSPKNDGGAAGTDDDADRTGRIKRSCIRSRFDHLTPLGVAQYIT